MRTKIARMNANMHANMWVACGFLSLKPHQADISSSEPMAGRDGGGIGGASQRVVAVVLVVVIGVII